MNCMCVKKIDLKDRQNIINILLCPEVRIPRIIPTISR